MLEVHEMSSLTQISNSKKYVNASNNLIVHYCPSFSSCGNTCAPLVWVTCSPIGVTFLFTCQGLFARSFEVLSYLISFPQDFQLSEPVSEPRSCAVPGWCNQSVQLASLTLIQQTKEDLLEPSNKRRSTVYATSQSFGSAMNPENALELLGPGYSNPLVRKYAVFRLKQADDEELELYLLQLVQALRYEDLETIKEGLHIQLMEFYDRTFASNFNEDDDEEEENPVEQVDLIRCHSCPHLFGKAFEQSWVDQVHIKNYVTLKWFRFSISYRMPKTQTEVQKWSRSFVLWSFIGTATSI